MPDIVNPQVTDEVTQTTLGASAVALAMLQQATAQALANAAHNATTAQQNANTILQATTTQGVALLYSLDLGGPHAAALRGMVEAMNKTGGAPSGE